MLEVLPPGDRSRIPAELARMGRPEFDDDVQRRVARECEFHRALGLDPRIDQQAD